MATQLRPYKYKGLLFRKSPERLWDSFTIRVLVLKPAADLEDDLICTFDTLELPNKKLYDAKRAFEPVSYVWGDPSLTHSLQCEGCEIQITASVDRVLRRFRKTDTERRLWVDAICINQKDNDEKMEQVQRMAQIYASASLQTLVWLGDDVHPKSMDFFWGLSSSKYESSTTADMADEAIKYELRRAFNNESLDPINAILALPWFKRRWVIQEAALSEVHLYCRDSDISWHALSHALVLLSASSFDIDRPLLQQLKIVDSLAADSHDGWGILDCMVGFKNTSCSDSRDRIYSLLSLADDIYGPSIERKRNGPKKSEGHLRIAPDYGVDPGTVYRSFAEHLIRRQSHLDLLQCAGAFPATAESGFPSWIPEWTQEMQYTPFLDVPWFTAGPKRAPKLDPKASTCYPWCFVNGVIVDSIAAFFPHSIDNDASSTGRKDLSQFEVIFENVPLFARYRTGERLWQILALTLIADHGLNHRLRTRVARPDSGWHDGRLMKKDARERDTQVLLDWFFTRDEDIKEQFRNGSRVLHNFEAPDVDDILQRCKDLSSTVHHTTVKSAYLKTEQSRHDWDETSSTSRSGWHSAIDPTDLPYMAAKMMKDALKNSGGKPVSDEAPSADEDTLEKRAKDLGDIEALIRALAISDDISPDGNDLGDLFDKPAPDQQGFVEDISASDSPAADLAARRSDKMEYPPEPEAVFTTTNPDETEVEVEDKEISLIESIEVGEDGEDGEDDDVDQETDDEEVETLPETTRTVRPQLDPEFMRRNPELMAEYVGNMSEMLALMATGNTDGLLKFMENQLRKAQADLKQYSTKIYGHATPEVLREHGLGSVADAIDEHNDYEQSLQKNQSGTNASDESDVDDFEEEEEEEEENNDDDDEDDNDQGDEPAEPGEYARLAAIGDLRGDEDGFVWFEPDEQNTQIYTELVHRTMEGRQLFFTDSGYVGIAPNAAKVGDSVAVFRGGRTPFIIRPHDDSAAWRLVGDSYVHGLMRGEAFEGEQVEERGFVVA